MVWRVQGKRAYFKHTDGIEPMTTPARMPDCPWCGDARRVYEEGDRDFYCLRCHRTFDEDPDEGGDFSQFDPSWRVQREEARKKSRKEIE